MLEAVSSFFLVVRNYTKKGYIRFGFSVDWIFSLLKITKQMLRHENEVLVATEEKRVVGTISYMVDNYALPIEALFPEELKEIRASSARIAYIGSFATIASKHCTRVALLLLRELEKRSYAIGITCAICVVHPAHAHFYTRYGFRVVKEQKTMSGLSENAAAVLLVKDNVQTNCFCK